MLEAKQGSEQHGPPALSLQAQERQKRRRRGTAPRGTAAWDTAMERAYEQAQRYARALPAEEIAGGRPPLLLVVDVGQSIALYSEWTRSGGSYLPFPDPANYRIQLDDQLRAGEPLDKKDKTVHEQGLVSVLRQLHDELDALVAGAYGWPADLPEDEILARLVALNAERVAEVLEMLAGLGQAVMLEGSEMRFVVAS